MAVPPKNPDEEFQGLPPLLQRSLKTLLTEPEDSFELATTYDILWRYLREQRGLARKGQSTFRLPEPIQTLSELQQKERILPQQPAYMGALVDFLFERFESSYPESAPIPSKLDYVIVQAYVQADNHYSAAIKKEPLRELPRKRLAFMSLTSNRFLDAQCQWEGISSMRTTANLVNWRHAGIGPQRALMPKDFLGENSFSLASLHERNVHNRNPHRAREGRKTIEEELKEIGWFAAPSEMLGIPNPRGIDFLRVEGLGWLQNYIPAEISIYNLSSILGLPSSTETVLGKFVLTGAGHSIPLDTALIHIDPDYEERRRNLLAAEQEILKNLNDEGGYLELYYHLMACKEPLKAIDLLECVTAVHPEFLVLRTKLASDLYVGQGQWLKSLHELEDISKHMPEEPSVIIPLIYLYEDLGMSREAESLWQDLINGMMSEENAGPSAMERRLLAIYGYWAYFRTDNMVSEIGGSRNSVYSVHNWAVSAFGLDFNVVAKFFQPDAQVVEYGVIETFRKIAKRRPELGLEDSLPTVRDYPREGMLTSGTCLVTEARGKNLEHLVNEDNFKDNLRSAVKLLAGIHAVTSDFPEGKLTDVIAEDENYFETRLRSILFDSKDASPSPEKSVVESFLSSYPPVSSVLKSQPRRYYKDANLRNWLYSPYPGTVTAIDFEKNWLLPPQLDLVSLLEFGSAYLDEGEIDGMLQTYYSSFCEFAHQEVPLSDFMEAYPYAAVQRHLELIGYRKRDFSSFQDEKELQVLEKKIDYHKNRALHYLSCLAEKHTGANREDILRLVELLPLFLPQFTAEQP